MFFEKSWIHSGHFLCSIELDEIPTKEIEGLHIYLKYKKEDWFVSS
jgi:hypothetical protein